MQKLNDKKVYLKRLQGGLYDKAWWLANIDNDISTIIDFGCASGDLFRFVDVVCPERFSYIGIETEKEFLTLCPQISSRTRYFKNFFDIDDIEWDKTILVLNSVCHELYNYSGKQSLFVLLRKAIKNNIRHIAIRDMFFNAALPVPSNVHTRLDNAFKNKFPEQNQDNIKAGNDWRELSMKYTYTENWEREVGEKYFHPTLVDDIYECVRDQGYKISKQYFVIPSQTKKFEKDLGESWPEGTTTHVKIWISR